MQILCDHCGNTLYASGSDTGIVDELLKRTGLRSSDTEPPRRLRDVDTCTEVAEELRELGMEVSDSEVSSWLVEETDTGQPTARGPLGLGAVAGWLERKESSLAPMKRELFNKLTATSIVRDDISWQRTPDGRLACSAHCYDQLAICSECGIPRTADEHCGCHHYVARCTEHGAEVLPFPGRP